MIRPRPEELLERAATILEVTVLPDIGDGVAQRQLRAISRLLHRLAFALPRRCEVLAADTADLATSLRQILVLLEHDGKAKVDIVDAIRPLLDESVHALPAMSYLEQRNIALQEALGALQVQLPSLNLTPARQGQIEQLLRELHLRTLDRESSLALPAETAGDVR